MRARGNIPEYLKRRSQEKKSGEGNRERKTKRERERQGEIEMRKEKVLLCLEELAERSQDI